MLFLAALIRIVLTKYSGDIESYTLYIMYYDGFFIGFDLKIFYADY